MNNIAWHLPKRCNLLQIVGSLYIIKSLDLDEKQWTKNNTKKFNQALGTWGLTTSGKSLSSTARETLEALIKYLGLIFIDNNKNIHITPAGFSLISEFSNFKKPDKKIKLKESEKIYKYQTSDVIKNQLIKLTISNPTIRESDLSKDILIKPFIEIIRYLLDNKIAYLSREEIALFIFFQQKPSDFDAIKQKIIDFRKKDINSQKEIIHGFESTYIGNKIYGESSATVKYWESLIRISNLFDEQFRELKLKKTAISTAQEIVNIYEYPDKDLSNDLWSWIEYFGNIKTNRYIREVDYLLPNLKNFKLLISVIDNDSYIQYSHPILKVEGDTSVKLKVFPDRKYHIKLKILLDSTGKTTDIEYDEKFEFGLNEYFKSVTNDLSISSKPPTSTNIKEELRYMLTENKPFQGYLDSIANLLVLSGTIKSRIEADLYIKRSIAYIKGGRFEKLFYELLKEKETSHLISKVVDWRGKEKFGISYPSPAGPGYETDIEFTIGNYQLGLELTTAIGRLQWKSEAESVTDHINNFKNNLASINKSKKAIGIFTAPVITEFMKAICFYFSEYIYKMPIIAVDGLSFFNILETSKNGEEIIEKLLKVYENNYSKKAP